jgi:hypothetical protein
LTRFSYWQLNKKYSHLSEHQFVYLSGKSNVIPASKHLQAIALHATSGTKLYADAQIGFLMQTIHFSAISDLI